MYSCDRLRRYGWSERRAAHSEACRRRVEAELATTLGGNFRLGQVKKRIDTEQGQHKRQSTQSLRIDGGRNGQGQSRLLLRGLLQEHEDCSFTRETTRVSLQREAAGHGIGPNMADPTTLECLMGECLHLKRVQGTAHAAQSQSAWNGVHHLPVHAAGWTEQNLTDTQMLHDHSVAW